MLTRISNHPECSGIHRSLGTHISKVRSINLDTVSWTPELIEVQKALGNQVTNSVWEATVSLLSCFVFVLK